MVLTSKDMPANPEPGNTEGKPKQVDAGDVPEKPKPVEGGEINRDTRNDRQNDSDSH
jgi:hypothetical protein